MSEFDVIIIGGGVNGLTAAAYLAKSGLKVLVLERRDELGAHCSTEEVTIPGFRHNLHATWIITATSPCIEDLELEKFGLEVVVTKYAYAYPFSDGRCVLMHTYDFNKTYENLAKFSPKDADKFMQLAFSFAPYMQELIEIMLFRKPTVQNWERGEQILNSIKGLPLKVLEANGFELLDILFESDEIKTMLASLQWIGGLPPWHRIVGSLGALMVMSGGPVYAIHQLRGGSHILPHALARCILHHQGVILQSCPVEKIIIEKGEAKGVILAKEAAYPKEKIYANKAIISNLTAVPTFKNLVGEENIPVDLAKKIELFNYDEQVLFGAHYALKEAPKWSAASFDSGIQECFMGYLGAESFKEIEEFAMNLINGRISDKIMVNWFVPTLADKTQAPEGCHTAFAWMDVPFDLRRYGGVDRWDEIKEELLPKITDRWNEYAPNFKQSILATYTHTPLDIYRRNPSALKGNWTGGSICPGQLYLERPTGELGTIAPRTPIKNLYISNSIWPPGMTFLGAGYTTAKEVADDLRIGEQPWWNHKPLAWYQKFLSTKFQR